MPIKVLHVIKGLGRGGAEMLLPATIARHSKEYTFDVVYFLPWKDQLVETLKSRGCQVTCLKANSTPAMLLTIPALVQHIRRNKYQLIHCHLPWSGIVGRIAARIAGCPVVYTEHNNFSTYNSLTKIFNKLTFPLQDFVVAVSEDAARALRENVGGKVTMRTILNGVDTEIFSRSHYDTALWKKRSHVEGSVLISTVAVFRKQKQLDRWIRLAAMISAANQVVKFVVIGDGVEKEKLHQLAAELGMQDKIIFTGILADPKPWLAASDIYLMSSAFEGLPVALLEAMSMACVPVVTPVGGITSVVDDQVNGLYYDSSNLGEASGAISKLISDKDRISRLSKNAREKVQNVFSISTMVAALEDVYRTVLAK